MIRYFEIEEIVALVDRLLSDTGKKMAFLNRINLEFVLNSVKTKFGNESSRDIMAKKRHT